MHGMPSGDSCWVASATCDLLCDWCQMYNRTGTYSSRTCGLPVTSTHTLVLCHSTLVLVTRIHMQMLRKRVLVPGTCTIRYCRWNRSQYIIYISEQSYKCKIRCHKPLLQNNSSPYHIQFYHLHNIRRYLERELTRLLCITYRRPHNKYTLHNNYT